MKENISMVTENGSEDNTKRSSDSESEATLSNRHRKSSEFRKPKLERRSRDDRARLSKLFRTLLKSNNTNQDILAERLGISQASLSRSVASESMSMRRFLDILEIIDCEFIVKSKHSDESNNLVSLSGNDPCDGCKYKSYYENMMNAQAQFEAKMLEDARAEAREHVKNLLMK